MTIINPKKIRRSFINPLMCATLMVVVCGTVGNILIYNKTVELKHAINEQEKIMERTRAQNASLKNEFYQALDTGVLSARAREQGFIKITAPQYLAAH